jgi:hypothetical protein
MGQTEIGSYAVTAFSPSGSRFFFSKPEESASEKRLVSVTGKTGELADDDTEDNTDDDDETVPKTDDDQEELF